MSTPGNTERATFATRAGAIAATVGSAVGLGNIWRFPYEAGTHGGGMFLICYVAMVLLLGIPLMCSEFVIGRAARANVGQAFTRLAPGRGPWYLVGLLSILAALLIMGFYTVVAGWTLEYFVATVSGGLDLSPGTDFQGRFAALTVSEWRPVVWTLLFLALNYAVLARGVTKGIERMSNIMMPMLFLILVAFCIFAATLPGFGEGIAFFFRPDFAHFDAATVLGALGQTFFSLSLGMGCMITYGSYLPRDSRIPATATTTVLLGTLVAFLAGVMIFPAVFTFGVSPQAGPPLIFETLPYIFAQLPWPALWSALFFFLLIIASLSSTISLSEIFISRLTEQRGMSRRRATLVSTLACAVMATLCALSFGTLRDVTVFGLTFFNLFDYVASNILLPVGGILTALFAGWVVKEHVVRRQLLRGYGHRARWMAVAFRIVMRYIAPAAIMMVFLNAIGII